MQLNLDPPEVFYTTTEDKNTDFSEPFEPAAPENKISPENCFGKRLQHPWKWFPKITVWKVSSLYSLLREVLADIHCFGNVI